MHRFHPLRAACTLALVAAATVHASPVVINTGSDHLVAPNGNTRTASFDSLGFLGSLNTTIMTSDPNVVGAMVIATNIPSIANFYGFSAGLKTAIDGSVINASFASDPAQNNFDSLTNPSNADLNGFTSGEGGTAYGAGASLVTKTGGAWGLTTSYNVVGRTVDTDGVGGADRIAFTSGVIFMNFRSDASDPNDGREVLRLNVEGSSGDKLSGSLDFSFAQGNSFVENFFEDASSGQSLYSLWLAGPSSLSFAIDFPLAAIPGPSSTWDTGQTQTLMSQGFFGGQLQINAPQREPESVPEPASLLLVGVALGALGAARRRAAR